MRIIKSLKKLVQSTDLFATNEFFRYQTQQTYQTFFGGSTSVLAFIIVAAIFYNRFLQCINKVNITSVEKKIFEIDPPRLDASTYPIGKFMAAIQVIGHNLVNPDLKFFRTTIQFYTLQKGTNFQKVQHELEPCTSTHWTMSPQLADDFKLLDMNQMMCLPLNVTIDLIGKSSSTVFKSFVIVLAINRDCPQNSSDLPRCPNEDEMMAFFGNQKQHKLQLYFTNFQIAPGKSKYINTFLDDRFFLFFTRTKGHLLNLLVQDYTVKTDEGIYYQQQPKVQTGIIVDTQPISYKYNLISHYCQIYFQRSLKRRTYSRSFQKMYDVLSLAGGLFGIICSSFFIIRAYNNSAYSLNLGYGLYKPSQDQEQKLFKYYKFSTYLNQAFYSFLTSIGFSRKWDSIVEYNNCQKEVTKTIDVLLLLQKFYFLENAVSVILQDHQVKTLHLRQKMTLNQAKRQRQLINFRKEFHKIKQQKIKEKQPPTIQHSRYLERNDTILKKKNDEVNDVKQETISEALSICSPDNLINQNKIQQFINIIEPIQAQEITQKSEAQSEQKKSEPQNRNQFLLQLTKINQEAKRGHRTSQRIMNLLAFKPAEALKRNSMNVTKDQNLFKRQYIKTETILEDQSQIEVKRTRFQPELKIVKTIVAKKVQSAVKFQQVQQTINKKQKPASNMKRKHQFLKKIQEIIRKADLFTATGFFRYESKKEYRTFFGGILTILMVVTPIGLFYGKFIDCFNKVTVYSTESTIFSNDPTLTKIATSKTPGIQQMMAYVDVNKMNLNNAVRYFDVSMLNKVSRFNESMGEWQEELIKYTLEPCTLDHWVQIPNMAQTIQIFNYTNFLCFPKGVILELQGKTGSTEFKTIEIIVQRCRDETDPSRPCDQNYTDWYVNNEPDSFLNFKLSNLVINPQNSDYTQYYLDQSSQFYVCPDMITTSSFQFEDYEILTDNSIFPWTDKVAQTGGMLEGGPLIKTQEDPGNTAGYAKIIFYKSFHTKVYNRSFEKFADVLSFMGGILRIISASLFVAKLYNKLAYEINLGSKLFKPDLTNKSRFKEYNFFSYIKQNIYDVLSLVGLSPNWEFTIECEKCQDEIGKQLDIMYILKRLEFLECSISLILESYEVKGLLLMDKPSVDQVKIQRTAFKLKKKILNMKKTLKLKQNFSVNKDKFGGKSCISTNVFFSPCESVKENEIIISDNFQIDQKTIGLQKPSTNFITSLNDLSAVQQLQQSSDSDSDNSDYEMSDKQINEMLENIKKIEQEMKEGCEVSSKIMRIVSVPTVARLLRGQGALPSTAQKPTKKSVQEPNSSEGENEVKYQKDSSNDSQ